MPDKPRERQSNGQFQKGIATNPEGNNAVTTKRKRADIKAYCARNSMRAVKAIMEIVNDTKASASVRMQGAQYIIDRAHGKPETLQGTTGGMFQGAKIIVNTGFNDAPELPAPTVDMVPVNGVDPTHAAPKADIDTTDK